MDLQEIKNIHDLKNLSDQNLSSDAKAYLNGGADDMLTVSENERAFRDISIRPRRLVDVSSISTNIKLFEKEYDSPIILSPVGFQQFFHPDGEIGSAKAAESQGHPMIVSSVSNYSILEIAEAANTELWFQLYPTPDRSITKILLENAENAGCKILVLTVDTPTFGNREHGGSQLEALLEAKDLKMGNFDGILPENMDVTDPSMTWEMISWLRENTNMRIFLKGIVSKEDAKLCLDYDVDGVIVSNHGGRQLETNLGSISCLSEVVEAINGEIPVLFDGGIRRGTDIFKALALGATAVCIGRPYVWGLGAMGQEGVEKALEILRTELVRDMQLAGTPSINNINKSFVSI